MLNDLFREYLDHFVVIYLDDILVFSSNLEEHTHYVRLVLHKLQEHGLYAKGEKYEFDRTSIEFLEYVISPSGIVMDESTVTAIQEWPTPTKIIGGTIFSGFRKLLSTVYR